MATYIVLTPPEGRDDDADAVFIRDGFSRTAFLLPPLWLLAHRLWLEAAIVALALVATLAVLPAPLSILAFGGIMLAVGFEGASLRVRALTTAGWRLVDIVLADRLGDAEAAWYAERSAPPAAPDRPAPPALADGAGRRLDAALGLMNPYGGR